MAGSSLSFSRHETFSFRYGWLKKGVDAAAKDPDFFSRDRALIDLGVGKNMVQAIRYWCLTAGLIQPDETAVSRSRLVPTELGKGVLSDGGYDPYLEDPG